MQSNKQLNIIKTNNNHMCGYAVYTTEALSGHDTYTIVENYDSMTKLVFLRNICAECCICEYECNVSVFNDMGALLT